MYSRSGCNRGEESKLLNSLRLGPATASDFGGNEWNSLIVAAVTGRLQSDCLHLVRQESGGFVRLRETL